MKWELTTSAGDIKVGYYSPKKDGETILVNFEMIDGELTFVGNRE